MIIYRRQSVTEYIFILILKRETGTAFKMCASSCTAFSVFLFTALDAFTSIFSECAHTATCNKFTKSLKIKPKTKKIPTPPPKWCYSEESCKNTVGDLIYNVLRSCNSGFNKLYTICTCCQVSRGIKITSTDLLLEKFNFYNFICAGRG